MLRSNQNERWFVLFVTIVVCLAVVGIAQADWPEQAKLLASDGASGDYFGLCVSISGDYAIVGAERDDSYTGSAYIFTPNDIDPNNWDQQAKLTASDGEAGDYFGTIVSISGDYAIVGAHADDSYTGSAYIFKRDGESWPEQIKLTASDGAADDRFGASASISGDYAIVGAYHDDGYTGSAYIFKRGDVPSDPNWYEQCKLTASDGAAGDYFGMIVSISGDYAIVAVSYDDGDNGDNSGSAYIFKRSDVPGDPNWYQQGDKLTASDGAAGDHFGNAASICGDYAIVGTPYDDGYTGKAYIFKRSEVPSDPNWYEKCKLTASDGEAGDWFGISVSISGDYAIVGAHRDDGDNGDDTGSAYLFKRNGESWTEQIKLIASDGSANDEFGCYYVSIDRHQTIVGAYRDDDNGTDSGSAYVFKRVCPTADLSGDCFVDFVDFAIFTSQWLQGN